MRPLPVLVLVITGLAGDSSLLGAHAELESANPAAGATVTNLPPAMTLIFGEEVRSGTAIVEVTGPDGSRIDAGNATVDLADPERRTVTVSLVAGGPGQYAVHWETISGTDADAASGDYTFDVAIGATPGAPAPFAEDSYGNPLTPGDDFDGRAFALSVGAGLLALAAIVGLWFAIRPREPKFGSRSGSNQR